jgi:hypothetical protein
MEIVDGEYILTDDVDKIKLEGVCNLLRQSHWEKS